MKVTLPTEAQWEWAARAGSNEQFFYGDKDTDFSRWANLADASRRRTFVKWDGDDMPATVAALQNKSEVYSHEEILAILATEAWSPPMEGE